MAGLGSRGQTLVLAWFAFVQIMDGKMSAQIQEELTRSANKEVQLILEKHWSYYAINSCIANFSLS